jgi:SanA protein
MKLKQFLIFLAWALGFAVLVIFIVNLVIHLKSAPYIYKNVSDVPNAQTALIPGAAVLKDGTLSAIFQDRVNEAIALYQAKKVSKILVSGDNSTVSHNEVNPVRDYLLQKGIPSEDIFLDHAGFDTYSTMYRARDIFQVSSVIIATQSFHLPRAVYIARSLGLNAYGISADKGNILFKNYFREVFADEKAVLDLALRIKPKFLGEVIPISGPGQNESGSTPVTTAPAVPPKVPTAPKPPVKTAGCFVGGCSNEICSDQQGIASPCIYRPEYACYKTATCERQTSGQCGWTQTPELSACLKSSTEGLDTNTQ